MHSMGATHITVGEVSVTFGVSAPVRHELSGWSYEPEPFTREEAVKMADSLESTISPDHWNNWIGQRVAPDVSGEPET